MKGIDFVTLVPVLHFMVWSCGGMVSMALLRLRQLSPVFNSFKELPRRKLGSTQEKRSYVRLACCQP